jgi:hypothetical protein
MRIFSSLLLCFCLVSSLFSPSANATSIGYLDEASKKFIVHTKLFFHGSAVDEHIAQESVEQISRLWNEPKINYYHNGIPYQMEFRFDYAVNDNTAYLLQNFALVGAQMPPQVSTAPASTDTRITRYDPVFFSNTFPLRMSGYLRMDALERDPELNVVKMVHQDKDNDVSSMVCGDQFGTFVIEDYNPKGTTFAHEFGHSLGLPHAWIKDCVANTPSIMCAKGSFTLPKYQYNSLKNYGEIGATINPIYRKVRIEDVLKINISKIPYDAAGYKIIGPHMKAVCEADHSSFNDPKNKK